MPDEKKLPSERQIIEAGKALPTEVSVKVGGRIFDGWESLSVTESIDAICSRFSLKFFDKFTDNKKDWPLKPGVPIKISIGKVRVLTGNIEKLDVSYTAENRGYTVSGRSRSGDLVDCVHLGDSEYRNIKLLDLATELTKAFGIQVYTSVDPTLIKEIDIFAIKVGETIFDALDRIARLQGFFWNATRGGNIRLVRAGVGRSVSSLYQDVNILSASATYDDSKRHNTYKALGQTNGLDTYFGKDIAAPFGEAKDLGVGRYRPYSFLAEGAVDGDKSQRRAEWECALRIGQASRIEISTRGWTQKDGTLWGVNQLIPVKAPFLGLNRTMLSSEVTWEKSGANEAGGTQTKIVLVDKRAYNPEPVKNKEDDFMKALGTGFSKK